MNIIIASNPSSLANAISTFSATGTVEAEYGSVCIEGSMATLAHHGARSGNLCPCLEPNRFIELQAIGISHIDLDTLGGIAALLGRKPEAPGFWKLASFVDVKGPHRLSEANASDEDLARLHAFWAWSESHKCFAPRDGSPLDVTKEVVAALAAIEAILADDPAMIAAGEAHRLAGEALESASFVERHGDVLLRSSAAFVNHLYTHETPARAVVGYSEKFKSITVSFADPGEGDNACEFVQAMWGALAGGHKGIAGSPRGQEMTLEDARYAACLLAEKLG